MEDEIKNHRTSRTHIHPLSLKFVEVNEVYGF